MHKIWSRSLLITSLLGASAVGYALLPVREQQKQPEAAVFYESFEGASPLTQPFIADTSNATAYSRTYVAGLAFKGNRSARIELRDTDPEIANGTRSEITFIPARQREQWYSFAMYFPADYWAPDSYPEIISQWHAFPDEALGEQWRSPATKLLVVQDRLRLDIGYHTAKVNTTIEQEYKYDLGPLPKDTWQHFVFRINHDTSDAGLVELWINGHKVLRHIGGNSFKDALLPFWKIGIYKWDWNGAQATDVNHRVLYLDEIGIHASAPAASIFSASGERPK